MNRRKFFSLAPAAPLLAIPTPPEAAPKPVGRPLIEVVNASIEGGTGNVLLSIKDCMVRGVKTSVDFVLDERGRVRSLQETKSP